MKILIVGCGKVGATLAVQLCSEGHDITVLDISQERLQFVTDGNDVMGVLGDGTSVASLRAADLEHMDLLCAVMNSDEGNLLCCLIARRFSKCKTIARVRNPIYTEEIQFFKTEFDLAMVINPELAAALDIARVFRFPSAININTFAKGRVELLRFRVKDDSCLVGNSLSRIRSDYRCDVLVCIAKRGDEVTIPSGDYVVEAGDILSVVADPKNASEFFQKIGLMTNPVKNVLIVGGGKITYYLTKMLHHSGISVKIIERDRKRCEVLADDLPYAHIICGDGTDEALLAEEGMRDVQGIAFLTGIDEENIMLSLYAREESKAKLVTKINRIKFDRVIEKLDLDSIVNPETTTAEYILQYARSMNNAEGSSVENLYTLENCLDAMEFILKKPSKVTGIPLKDLNIKDNIIICKIHRNGELITPGGQTTMEVGDTVVLVARRDYKLDNIDDILTA